MSETTAAGPLALRVACGDYDRTHDLARGPIQPEGAVLDWVSPPIEEIIGRMLREQAYDVAEMSLSAAAIAVDRGDPPLVPLPVFPSRFFRHSSVFVHREAGIDSLDDLRGRRVGMYNFHRMAAAVWFKGTLADDHGITPDEIDWHVADPLLDGSGDGIRVETGPDVRVTAIPPDRTLDDLLAAGDIDALLAIRMPRPFAEGDRAVRRLYADPQAVEAEYFARTGIFPIMHTLVVRADVLDAHPELGPALCEAFEAARVAAERRNYDLDAAHHSLAWWVLYTERERGVLGPDAWAYGLQANRALLATFLRYCAEQGLTSRQLAPEELFARVPWSPTS